MLSQTLFASQLIPPFSCNLKYSSHTITLAWLHQHMHNLKLLNLCPIYLSLLNKKQWNNQSETQIWELIFKIKSSCEPYWMPEWMALSIDVTFVCLISQRKVQNNGNFDCFLHYSEELPVDISQHSWQDHVNVQTTHNNQSS